MRTRIRRFSRILIKGFSACEYNSSAVRFGNSNHQYFFGYYDVSPFNYDDSVLLALRAPVENTPPFPDTSIHIGYFEIEDPGTFYSVGQTTTWCWQLGCRLQWYPLNKKGENNTIIYNKLIDNSYGCCIQDITSKKILHRYGRPIYSVSPDGRFGLSLNFSRLERLRPGYGYKNLRDKTKGQRVPKEDGIWYLDLVTGKDRLLFSIADILQLQPLNTMQDAVHYFNHICINPNGNRFLFFHVWLQKEKRYTRLITSNPDGSELYVLINEGHVSHYTWRSNDELLCFSTHANSGTRYYLYKDKTEWRKVFGEGIVDGDGHPSYSPDGKSLLTDTLPDKFGDRHLLLLNLEDNSIKNLSSFFSPFRYVGELRCDLHPRWSPSGQYVAFDSAHEGKRSLYSLRL